MATKVVEGVTMRAGKYSRSEIWFNVFSLVFVFYCFGACSQSDDSSTGSDTDTDTDTDSGTDTDSDADSDNDTDTFPDSEFISVWEATPFGEGNRRGSVGLHTG